MIVNNINQGSSINTNSKQLNIYLMEERVLLNSN